MKKLVFMFVMLMGMSLASCGNGAGKSSANDSTAVDSDSVVLVDSLASDSVNADSTVCPD